VKRHQQHILNLIHRSLGDRAQAEDVAQKVFLRVWRAAKGYEPKAKFTTWVYRIAVNLCRDAMKSAHHKQAFIHPDTGSEEQGENNELLYGCDRGRRHPFGKVPVHPGGGMGRRVNVLAGNAPDCRASSNNGRDHSPFPKN